MAENARNIGPVPAAIAPFNFIPYDPDAVLDDWPKEERGHWSGRIVCQLKALTPLLVSGPQTKSSEDEPSECRFATVDGKPVIPGTSIKGMLRNLVQILSFSAMRPVCKEHLFWRRVNRSKSCYMKMFSDEIQGGFLRKRGAEYFLVKTTVEARSENFEEDPEECRKVKTGGFGKKEVPAYAFLLPEADAPEIPLDGHVVADLWEQMTPNQILRYPEKERKEKLASSPGLPVFYREEDGKIAGLGFCRYFRIKYKFTPQDLAFPGECGAEAKAGESAKGKKLDFATRLFGTTDGEALKGRVSVACAIVDGKLLKTDGMEVIPGSPKPTCLPLYLAQNSKNISKMDSATLRNDIESFNDYNGVIYKDGREMPSSRLRGWKMYWHHDVGAISPRSGDGEINKKILSRLYPLRQDARAEIVIHVDRLTDQELGALLEAIQLPGDHAHKLGMGKAFGYGSVRLDIDWEKTDIKDMRALHQLLTDRLAGDTVAFSQEKMEECRNRFRAKILEKIQVQMPEWKKFKDFEDLPPIRALRLMMNYEQRPKQKSVRFMPLNATGDKDPAYDRNGVLPPPEKVNSRAISPGI